MLALSFPSQSPSPETLSNLCSFTPPQTNAQPRSPTPNAESDCAHGNAMGQSLSAGGVGRLVPLQKN